MDAENAETSTSKKDPFEQLSKKELIKKCRQFLAIAQKAKQSKDELTEENKALTNKLKEYDVKSMQEMINVLTHQKLDLVSSNDLLTKQSQELKNKFLHCQQELTESNTKLHNQDIENQGFCRQIKRLTEENDQLINHLDQLEKRIIELNKIGEQQRIQLLALEKQNVIRSDNQDNKDENTNTLEVTDNSTINKDFEKLQLKYDHLETEINNTKLMLEEKDKMLDNLNEELDTLKMENTQINELKKYCQLKNNDIEILNGKIDSLNIIINDLNIDIKDKSSNIVKLTNEVNSLEKESNEMKNLLIESQNKYENLFGELENTKKAKENNNEKLKSYHSKLIKVFNDLKDLKLTKNQLLNVIDNYSNYINKWQSDIKCVANKFKEEIDRRDSVINSYKMENSELSTKIETLENDLTSLKLTKVKSDETDELNTEIKLKEEKIIILYDENKKLSDLLEASKEETSNLTKNAEKLECCLKENETLIEELKRSALDNSSETSLKNEIQNQKNKIDNLLKENEQLSFDLSTLKDNLTLFNDKFHETREALENKISEHVDRIKSSEELLIKIQNENKLLSDNINLRDEEINTLNSGLQSIEHIENEKCKLYDELETIREKLKILTGENNDLRKVVDDNKNKIETENNKVKLKLQQSELKCSEYIKIMEDLRKDLESHYNINEKYSELSEINRELTEKIDILNVSIDKNEKEKRKLLNDIESINEKLKMLTNENNDLRKIIDGNKNLELDKNKIETENNNVKLKLQQSELKCSEYMKTMEDLRKDLENNHILNEKYSELSEINKELTEKINILNVSIDNNEKEKCELSNDLETIREKFELLANENKDLQKIVHDHKNLESNKNKIETEYGNIKLKLQQSETKCSEYTKIIEDLRNDLESNYKITEKYSELSKINRELTEKIDILNVSIDNNEKEISSYERDCSDLRNQVSISKRENADLLREMNDMNQALKERGETISKQQEYAQELIRKMQNLEQESKNCKEENVKFEEEITVLKNKASTLEINTAAKEQNSLISEKNEIIKSLEEEVRQLKESFNSSLVRDNQDGGDCETMSTSTISRTEDANRLRDLEGSWEERYTKLRTLALKLKGKVKELTEQVNVERTEKSEIQNKVTSITRNLQTIQSEYDKLQDQFENLEKENKKKIKQIETLTQENNNIKQEMKDSQEKISKLEAELDSLRKEKLGSNSANKHYTTQIQNLKKDIEDNNNKIKDLNTKIAKLEGNVSSKEQDLQNEVKNHNSTKEKLQKIEKENKKNSVLSLEMEDYERSLKELSQKLEKKNELITKLEDKTDNQESSISSLKNQLKILEDTISEKDSQYLDLEKRLLEAQTKISSAEATTAQKENRIREILKSLEEYKSKSEEENTDLAQILAKNQHEIEILKTDRDHSKSVVLGLEEKIRELTKISNGLEEELDHLKNEYSNYKVRAQSVLRQNQNRDVALEERLSEEVSELKSKVELLNAELETTTIKLKTISDQYELISEEKTKILLKNEELEQQITKQKEENENLLTRQHQLVSEHRESMRAQKIHTDTLTQCYKQQLSEQEERHVKELTELKALQIHSNLHISKNHEEHIDVTSMPREDGEGSESIGSNNYPSKNSILSLDKLLNPDNDSNLDFESELAQLKKRVAEYEAKVSHLTDLLADTEQDLAKHAQLNQHLKEEIRRHQRSVEREKHAENLEYLKNVVFKFLTLHNGDEKSHLVPVLNTILKLSPEETQKLNAVAKGTDLTRGWGSYLPLWSGSNNQN